jgi:hypothetical protein
MAIYSFSAGVFSRSKGHRVTAAAAYRAGALILDGTIGERFDYTRKRGILYSEILAPDNAPAWSADREQLWNRVEAQEKRSDSQLAREVLVALPHELDQSDQLALLRGFIREEFVARGMIADVSVHAPSRDGDERNVHAHILLTMRPIAGDGFGKKAREWNSDELLSHWRKAWADHCNDALEEAGFDARVDHRSLESQGVDRIPGEHKGKATTAQERRGETNERLERQRKIEERNASIDQTVQELAAVDAEIAASEERRLDERFGPADPEEAEIGAGATFEAAGQGAPIGEPEPLTDDAKRAASDAIADAAPYREHIRDHGEIPQPSLDGLPWWQRAVSVIARWRDQVVDLVRDSWEKIVEERRPEAEKGDDIEPDRQR